MTQAEKQMTVEEDRDLWKEIAISTKRQLDEASKQGDEASNLLAVATAGITQLTEAGYRVSAEPAPAPAPPPPPVPVAPPPPRPASMIAFLRTPEHEQKAVAAAYGGRDKLMEELSEADHARNSNGGFGHGGSSSHRIVTFGENRPPSVAEAQERARAEVAAYQANAPRPIPRGTPDARAMHQAALDRQVGWGGPAVSSTGKPPTPKAAPFGTPAPGKKMRHLGGFGIR